MIEKQVAEIKRMQNAIEKTNSEYLKKDYSKNIEKRKNQLRKYCYSRGYSYKDMLIIYGI